MRRLALLFFVLWAVLAVPHAGAEPEYGKPDIDEECRPLAMGSDSRSALSAGRNRCRQERDSPDEEPHEAVWSVHRGFPKPSESTTCTDGAWDPQGTRVAADPLELAKQQCNRHNVTLKKDLVECFEYGIGIKTNEKTASTTSNACPEGKEVEVHEITDNAICELSNPTEMRDPGNGEFSACLATGPGPRVIPDDAKPSKKNGDGCCVVYTILNQKHDRGFELAGTQAMLDPGSSFFRREPTKWSEDYFAKTAGHEIWMCNPPSTPENVAITHYYCAETSQDIMVEGWQNPVENDKHRGPGWCNVTTGDYNDDDDIVPIDQVFADLANALQYLGGPKGIVDPHTDPRYDPSDARKDPWMCRLRRDAFDTHCSNDEIVSTNQLAHSMGAIAAAAWGIPFDFFGGSVTGPPDPLVKPHGRGGGMRNNCDLVPAVVNFAHRYAIFFYARQHFDTKSGGVGHYRWCNGTSITNNCVLRDATYKGKPLGPRGCGPNGTDCEYAPWCDWFPYGEKVQEESGRLDFAPLKCTKAASDLIEEVGACLQDKGLGKIQSCLQAAYDAAHFYYWYPGDVDDHGFDDKKDWGGYRVLTKPNWDVPRREHDRGSVVTHVGPSDPGVCENDSMSVPKWYCHIE